MEGGGKRDGHVPLAKAALMREGVHLLGHAAHRALLHHLDQSVLLEQLHVVVDRRARDVVQMRHQLRGAHAPMQAPNAA